MINTPPDFNKVQNMNDIELYKPNEFIGPISQLDVSRTARHLLNYLFQYAQIELHKASKNNEVHGNTFEVSVHQINGLAEFQKHDYERLKQTLLSLIQPVVFIENPKRFKASALVCDIDVDVEKGLYVFSITDTVKQLLQNTEFFTKLKLSEFNGLQSKYSIIIYEWLKRFETIETAPKMPLLQIDVLRKKTNTADKKTYDNYTNIRDKILDIAVTEINEKTPYTVTYETIKTRTKRRPKVTAIQFYFAKKEIKTEAENKPESDTSISFAFKKLRNVCSGRYMTLKFYYEATYIYEPETLEVFADDCLAKNYHPNKTVFFEWLNERCSINQKGYHKQKYIYSEEFFKSVFCTETRKYSMMIPMSNGESMPAGLPEIIVNVKDEYVAEAMKFYGKLPYNEYKRYLSGIWQRFQQEFNVNKDNVFE